MGDVSKGVQVLAVMRRAFILAIALPAALALSCMDDNGQCVDVSDAWLRNPRVFEHGSLVVFVIGTVLAL